MRRVLAALRTPPPPAPAATAEATPADAAEAPGACGWFDSSHALQQGLCVTEHASADAVSAELPLADWLHLHLGGWPAPPLQSPHAAARSPH